MATVNRRGNSWQATVRGPDGREVTKAFPKRVQADQWGKEREADKLRGAWIDPRAGRESFGQWVQRYLKDGVAHKRATRLARDKTVLNHWVVPTFGRRAIGSITPHDVRTVVQSMIGSRLAPRTIRTNYGVFRAAMSAAVDAELIAVNPCRGVRLPDVPKLPKPVAPVSDVHRLADAVPDEYRPAIYLGSLGLREAEVFGLRVKAIDFLRTTVRVEETVNEVDGQLIVGDGKTRSSVRTISLPDFIVEVLAVHLQRTGRVRPKDYVLQAPGGGPVRANNFRRRVYRPALQKAKLDSGLTFHRLRHSAGHHMRETGEPLEVIQKRLGHASIRTTADVYGSLPVAVDQAASDRLNALYESSRGHFADMDEAPSSA
jgi:integrase